MKFLLSNILVLVLWLGGIIYSIGRGHLNPTQNIGVLITSGTQLLSIMIVLNLAVLSRNKFVKFYVKNITKEGWNMNLQLSLANKTDSKVQIRNLQCNLHTVEPENKHEKVVPSGETMTFNYRIEPRENIDKLEEKMQLKYISRKSLKLKISYKFVETDQTKNTWKYFDNKNYDNVALEKYSLKGKIKKGLKILIKPIESFKRK